MKNYLIIFLFFPFIVSSQWSSVKSFDLTGLTNSSIGALDFTDDQNGYMIGHYQEVSDVNSIIYNTHDGGISWDSTILYTDLLTSVFAVDGQIAYASGYYNIYPTVGSPYQRKSIYRTIDGGQTWIMDSITIDPYGNFYNCLAFINDSTGIAGTNGAIFYTSNYGADWNIVANSYGKNPILLGNNYAYFESQNVHLLDTTSLNEQIFTVNGICEGSISSSRSHGDTLLRYIPGQDGPERGYPFNNYAALTLTELPFGNERVMHFPEIPFIGSLAINSSGLYIINKEPLRSMDSGYSFFRQECTDIDALDIVFTRLDFVSENVGFALTLNMNTNIVKIQKTTNAGGITTNYITPPLQFTAEINEHSKNSISIYPNPTYQNLTITSTELINQIEIIDLFGRSILVLTEINTVETTLDLSKYSNGNYIVKVSTNSNTEFHSLVKN